MSSGYCGVLSEVLERDRGIHVQFVESWLPLELCLKIFFSNGVE